MSELRVRRATPDDAAATAALLARSYDRNPKADQAVLRWQYWDNPFGPARSWVAEADGALVGHWAAVPVPVHVDGRAVAGAKGVDIATDPAHRGRGVFTAVARALVDDAHRHGLEVLLTHPNPASVGAVRHAGAALVGCATAHVRPLDAAWLARRLHVPAALVRPVARAAPPEPGGDQAVELAAPPADLDALWARVAPAAGTGIVRDATWWRWRYGERPGGGYRFVAARRAGVLTGAAALAVHERYGGRFGLVCELLAVDRRAARDLVGRLAGVARARGAVGLAAVALPGSREAHLASRAGLRRLPRRLEPRPLRVMVLAPGADSAALAARRWTMAWGDLDHL